MTIEILLFSLELIAPEMRLKYSVDYGDVADHSASVICQGQLVE